MLYNGSMFDYIVVLLRPAISTSMCTYWNCIQLCVIWIDILYFHILGTHIAFMLSVL
jgi:hypothetical protein